MAVTRRSNSNVTFQCAFHVVWCSKYHRQVLSGDVEARLKEVIADTIVESGAWLVELEVMPDHVHLLVEVDPQFGISRLVRIIKGKSSRGLNRGMAAASPAALRAMLTYKTKASGVTLVVVPAHQTSQRCHQCTRIAAENRESQAVFHCVRCGYHGNADYNAARNILDRRKGLWGRAMPPRVRTGKTGAGKPAPAQSVRPRQPQTVSS
jgi:putative transposase